MCLKGWLQVSNVKEMALQLALNAAMAAVMLTVSGGEFHCLSPVFMELLSPAEITLLWAVDNLIFPAEQSCYVRSSLCEERDGLSRSRANSKQGHENQYRDLELCPRGNPCREYQMGGFMSPNPVCVR